MALNPSKISFLFERIRQSDSRTFRSTVAQLFTYLSKEIKDNPVYDKYETEKQNWGNWLQGNLQHRGHWKFPDDFDKAKSLSYYIYKRIAENDERSSDSFINSLFTNKTFKENHSQFNSTFFGYFEQALEEIVNANPEIEDSSPKKVNYDTAFIVHGHDNELKTEVQLLLNRAGVNSIVLHEQRDKGRTIIDKLIGETEIAGYAIALLTPDDLTKEGYSRARQNVILEIGYFLGELGKERVRIIVKGEVEIPSDLSGILYEKYDIAGAWKMKLLKEIQAVGIHVDISSVMKTF